MLKGLSGGAATWLLVLVCGCGEGSELVKPDRMNVGVSARQLRGSNMGFKVNTVMPVWEVQAKKRLTENLDLYAKGQFNQGTVNAKHSLFNGEGKGYFGDIGGGINYFPFPTRTIGLDVGLEAYHSEYGMRGGWGPIRETSRDQFWGGGANVGAVGEIPLDRQGRFQLYWGAGYHFTETRARQAHVNLDGWYGTINFQYSW